MEPIFIPNLLKSPDRQKSIALDDFIPGMQTLTPLRGILVVRHGGNFLEVSLKAETIVTLTCDRCLQQYNHRLPLDVSEVIWLDREIDMDKAYPLEREVAYDDLSETLSPDGYFDTEKWIYEQLCLALPLRQLCGKDCQPLTVTQEDTAPAIDSRWASLESLKRQLSGS
ncbi:YceD family protein [Pannus brasiliensis CCIBt3594]|uniref:YceD family protein n=1 Tax=Pannus brasiliensis CCIBt3594 TaxID=1427578 RepID=A0AAW9QQL4_9CHRO